MRILRAAREKPSSSSVIIAAPISKDLQQLREKIHTRLVEKIDPQVLERIPESVRVGELRRAGNDRGIHRVLL